MDRANLQITSRTTNDKKITTNVGYVNPNASGGKLYTLATTLINLTTDTFIEAKRVYTSEVLEDEE